LIEVAARLNESGVRRPFGSALNREAENMAGKYTNKFWLLAAAASAALVGQANAQTPAPTQPEAAESDEIIVTATRREARLQDVPVAVTPVSAELIENSGIRDLQDLTSVAPSLQFNVSENETSATARLRGIGTQGSNPGLESAVGIFIDGVYRARNGVALSDLGEIQQVEVLRGPQGTLFGRNTSAGLINVTTAGPDMEAFGAGLEATYGEFNETRLAGHITGPIADGLGFRLFAAKATRDGFLDSFNAAGQKTDVNNRDVWTARGQILWEPNSDFSLRLIADYSERDEICCGAQIYNPTLLNGSAPLLSTHNTITPGGIPQTPFQPSVVGVSSPGQAAAVAALGGYGPGGLANLRNGDIAGRFSFANRVGGQQLQDSGVSIEANWTFGDTTLTSVTAYRDWVYDQGQDADFSAADLWYRPNNGLSGFDFKVLTQEFRLAGESETGPLGRMSWLFGAFYSDEVLGRRDNLTNGSQFGTYFGALNAGLYGALAAPGGANNTFVLDRYKQNGTSMSVFTHNIWSIDEKTDLTIGGRVTREEKDAEGRFFTSFNAQPTLVAVLNGVSAGLGTAFGNCGTALPGGAANAAVIGARAVYCIPTLRSQLDGVRNQKREEQEFSGVVSARRTFSDALSGYVSYSRGYKGGGFNLDRSFGGTTGSTWNTAFNSELVDTYELGLKATLFSGDLLLNTALFFNEFEDYQLNTFNGVSFQVSSIPQVTSQGVEVDMIWDTPIDGLSMQGGVVYSEAEYGDDKGWVAQSANPLNPTARPVNFRLPGSRLTNAPLWTVTNAFTYERDIGAATGLAYLDFRYVSDQVTGSDLENTKVQPGYFLVNGRLGLKFAEDRLGVEVWGRNLLDQEAQQIAFNVPLQGNARGAFLNDPRTFGITLRANY
jgi:outer membrane receptor protein involved in Fe transport